MMRRPIRLFLFSVVASVLPYLLYRNILSHNETPASLEDLPSDIDIAASLMCFDPDNAEGDPPFSQDIETGPPFQSPLSTEGRYIIDANGMRVKLVSINWYGASDQDFVPGGLDMRHRKGIARTIRKMGFNSVRLPYSDEMVRLNPVVEQGVWTANLDLLTTARLSKGGLDDKKGGSRSVSNGTVQHIVRALDVYHAVVEALTDEGLAVIVNNHITQSRWCCDGNLCDAAWSNDYLGSICRVTQTEEEWMENWETIMKPHIDNSLVIGADLRNEIRSPFGKFAWNAWAVAAEKLSVRLLAMQPNWLMIVEGVASANFLQGVHSRPIQLPIPKKLVYSVHIYGWSGWGDFMHGPYWKRPFNSFASDMYDNWAFIIDEEIAPVWVGEIGAPELPKTGDLNYWKNLMVILEETDVDFAYWAINPRKPNGNETESYSLILDDWATPKCDYRLNDIANLGLGENIHLRDSRHSEDEI